MKYSELLSKLQNDIVKISHARKKKRWKLNQKVMIDFINGVTKKAVFEVNGKKIVLFKGDDRKGFKHILKKHYVRYYKYS